MEISESQLDTGAPSGGAHEITEADFDTPQAPPPSKLESTAQGAVKGASLGFADEIQAALDTAVSHIPGVRSLAEKSRSAFASVLPASQHLPVDNPLLTYAQRRDYLRGQSNAAAQANPGYFTGGEIGGAVATSLIPGAGAPGTALKTALGGGRLAAAAGGLAQGALQGGLAAYGGTEKSGVEALKEAGKGAAAGGITGGILSGGGAVLQNRAVQKAEQAAASSIAGKGEAAEAARAVAKENPRALYEKTFGGIQKLVRAGKHSEALTAIDDMIDNIGAKAAKGGDVRQNAQRLALLAGMRDTVEQAAAKAKPEPSVASRAIDYAKTHIAPMAIVGALAHGDAGKAALAAAGAGALAAGKVIAPKAEEMLARITMAAQQGNPAAIRLLNSIRAGGNAAAQTAGSNIGPQL
jgi:hypothetical protein